MSYLTEIPQMITVVALVLFACIGFAVFYMATKDEPPEVRPINRNIHGWFGLTYASWLTLPRVLMEDMPEEWQVKMVKLLEEYDDRYLNQPHYETAVQLKRHGRFVKVPEWLINYRRPDSEAINKLKTFPETKNE
jgi:hypothetical protein